MRESLGPKAQISFTFDDAKIAARLHSHLAFDWRSIPCARYLLTVTVNSSNTYTLITNVTSFRNAIATLWHPSIQMKISSVPVVMASHSDQHTAFGGFLRFRNYFSSETNRVRVRHFAITVAVRWLFIKNVSKKRSDLIVGSHLNISGVITANYDELNRLYRGVLTPRN